LIPQKEIVNLIVCLFVCLFVFFSILWYTQTGNHSQEDLAKFGYILLHKKNFKYMYILATIILGNRYNLANMCQNHILQVKKMWKFTQKKPDCHLGFSLLPLFIALLPKIFFALKKVMMVVVRRTWFYCV
jgi:hypothetical protein